MRWVDRVNEWQWRWSMTLPVDARRARWRRVQRFVVGVIAFGVLGGMVLLVVLAKSGNLP